MPPTVLNEKTLVPLGIVCAALILAVGVIQPFVTSALATARTEAESSTRVNMTLEEHGKRISKIEARQEYIYDAMRRLETHFGTLPTQPAPKP